MHSQQGCCYSATQLFEYGSNSDRQIKHLLVQSVAAYAIFSYNALLDAERYRVRNECPQRPPSFIKSLMQSFAAMH